MRKNAKNAVSGNDAAYTGRRVMKVTRCDRCGSIFENSTYTTIRVIKSINNQRDYDLCENCEKNLEEFLKVTKKEE